MNKALIEEALLLAMQYVRYVQGANPDLHVEANGSPSVVNLLQRALDEIQPDYVKRKP